MSSRPGGPEGVTLSRLLAAIRGKGIACELRGSPAVTVSGVSDDSRAVAGGELFLAWRGTARDAHDFVADAVGRGAAAAMVERYVDVAVPQIRVREARRAAAVLAEAAAGNPARHLHLTAVTGTNGKTTCSLLIRHILAAKGPSVAVGTLGVVGVDGEVEPGTGGLTTPGAVELSGRMRKWVTAGVATVTVEASSHALDQHRLDGVGVDVAVLTNLTREHLDYHGSMERYRKAKARILFLTGRGGGVVVNGEDPAWSHLPAIDARLIVTRAEGRAAAGRPPWGFRRAPGPRGRRCRAVGGREPLPGGVGRVMRRRSPFPSSAASMWRTPFRRSVRRFSPTSRSRRPRRRSPTSRPSRGGSR